MLLLFTTRDAGQPQEGVGGRSALDQGRLVGVDAPLLGCASVNLGARLGDVDSATETMATIDQLRIHV